MAKAGYVEEWKYHNTYSGTPQGGIVSPILANIYLHELDCYVEALIADFTKGEVRSVNREWKKISSKASRLNKDIKQEVDQEARSKLLEHKKDLLRLKGCTKTTFDPLRAASNLTAKASCAR